MPENKELFEIDSPTKAESTQIRLYAYMVYPDSVNMEKLIEVVSSNADSRRSYLLSPLHDKDVFDDGTPKKPHYHLFCMISNTSTTTIKQARRFGELMGLVGLEIIHSKIGYARYLCHLDNKDKYLYNVDDVRAFGCDYKAIIGNTEDKYKNIREIITYIRENDILFYCDLVDYCMKDNDLWFKSLISGATFQIEKYIKERRSKKFFKPDV